MGQSESLDTDQKVVIGLTLSNLTSDIFILNNTDQAGEQRVNLQAKLVKVG